MGSLRSNTNIIYESPDGGETIYARYQGETDRWMVGQSAKAKSLVDELREKKLWDEIRRAAKSNQILQEALDRAIMIYHLSQKNNAK